MRLYLNGCCNDRLYLACPLMAGNIWVPSEQDLKAELFLAFRHKETALVYNLGGLSVGF